MSLLALYVLIGALWGSPLRTVKLNPAAWALSVLVWPIECTLTIAAAWYGEASLKLGPASWCVEDEGDQFCYYFRFTL